MDLGQKQSNLSAARHRIFKSFEKYCLSNENHLAGYLKYLKQEETNFEFILGDSVFLLEVEVNAINNALYMKTSKLTKNEVEKASTKWVHIHDLDIEVTYLDSLPLKTRFVLDKFKNVAGVIPINTSTILNFEKQYIDEVIRYINEG